MAEGKRSYGARSGGAHRRPAGKGKSFGGKSHGKSGFGSDSSRRSEGRYSERRSSGERRESGRRDFERQDRSDRRGGYGRSDRNERNDSQKRFSGGDGERQGNPRYSRDGQSEGRFERRFDRSGERGADRGTERSERRDSGRRDGGRGGFKSGGFKNSTRSNHQGRQSSANYDNPRLNSDGTVSFPSQNPYTDRRPGEPKMPKGLEWSMLSKDEKERLRGLSKEHAENIGLHMLAAYALEEDDPQGAMAHAQWVAKQASRVDVSRETLAFIAYRQGEYKLALKEFRTAFRMNGYGDYLPFMADCERGLGNPQKAVDIALSEDAKLLQGEAKAELFLVYAGALADLDLFDKAVEVVHTIARAQGVGGAYRMRALQAEQNFLELAGRLTEAEKLEPMIEKLEAQYADVEDIDDDDMYIDNDLEVIDEDMLRDLGIDPSAVYELDDDDDYDAEDDEPEVDDSESDEGHDFGDIDDLDDFDDSDDDESKDESDDDVDEDVEDDAENKSDTDADETYNAGETPEGE